MPEFLFTPVPHDTAIDFIRSKPVVSREVFDQLLPELQARAFTISGMVPADIAQTVRDLIADLPAGQPFDSQKKLITEALAPYLGDGAAAKAELLLRVHGQEAYASAADAVMRRQQAVFPYWQYRTMGDSKVRPSHRALNGLILPANSSFWETHDPPWEWGCRCIKIPISQHDYDEINGRARNGDTAGGWTLPQNLQRELETTNRLVRGVNVHDVAPTGTFRFNPEDLTLSVDQIRDRYSPEVWSQFESWARKTNVTSDPGARTVWQWMNGEPGAPESASVGDVRSAPPAAAPSPTPLEATERRIMLNKTESAHLFTDENTLVFSKSGTKNYVEFERADVAKMKDGVLTHNHPQGTAFSPADIQMAFRADLAEIRAIGRGRDGRSHLYRLLRPAGGWPSDELPDVIASYNSVSMDLRFRWKPEIDAGRLDRAYAETEHNHRVMLRLAELYPGVINYERIEI